jgi:hypothetical protein
MGEKGIFHMKGILNPEDYGIVFCPLCNKNAKFPDNVDGFNACIRCGGFGLIMKEKQAPKKKQKSTRPRKGVPISYED